MDTSRIQEIILKVNGNDAEKTIKHIQGVIEKAKKAKRLERAFECAIPAEVYEAMESELKNE